MNAITKDETDAPAEEADAEEAQPETDAGQDPERQEPDAEPEEEEEEPEGEATVSVQDLDKALERLDREASRHANRVSEIMGEDAQMLVPCELCAPAIPGFRFPVPPDDEVKERVLIALGQPPRPDYLKDSYSRTCEACAGLGEVLTGSQVKGRDTLPCYTCKGQGWVPVGGERAGGSVPMAAPTASPPGSPPVVVVQSDPPEVAALKARGYVIIAPPPSVAH